MDSLGTAISVALQYGVPVVSLVTKFAHQRFEPMGLTQNSDIPFAKSLVDYIFRWFGMQFITGYREANAPQRIPGMSAGDHAPPIDTARLQDSMRTVEIPPSPTRPIHTEETIQWQSNRFRTGFDESIGQTGPTARGVSAEERIASQASTPRPGFNTSVGGALNRDPSATTPIIFEHGEMRQLGTPAGSAADQAATAMMGDAPACDGCGSITVRNGTCYRCWNCGNSMGCS